MDERGAWRGIGEDQALPELGYELQGRWEGMELPGVLAVGRRCGDRAVLVGAWEGADEGPAGGLTPLAGGGREASPPCRKADRATGHLALKACRLDLSQGKPAVADQRFVLCQRLVDLRQ
jgi:hypothetical protein